MTSKNNNSEITETEVSHEYHAQRPVRHTKPKTARGMVFHIRQVLNVLFMLTGIVGALMYAGVMGQGLVERQGIIVIIIAVSIKMAECMLRFKK
ncbi:MAG: hypothetical protein Q4E63_00075 [Prevotellaceae bacterium]|nr:hypothetical protein [Prevotellaceae bacterium]MDO4931038.1 hypothetical protein [Prevotellaceae bacterium]